MHRFRLLRYALCPLLRRQRQPSAPDIHAYMSRHATDLLVDVERLRRLPRAVVCQMLRAKAQEVLFAPRYIVF